MTISHVLTGLKNAGHAEFSRTDRQELGLDNQISKTEGLSISRQIRVDSFDHVLDISLLSLGCNFNEIAR